MAEVYKDPCVGCPCAVGAVACLREGPENCPRGVVLFQKQPKEKKVEINFDAADTD
jgi:hypothetical protein